MSETSAWVRLLYGLGGVLLFGGSLFLVDGAWQSGRRYLHSAVWPATKAHVDECAISGYWHYAGSSHSRQVWGKTSYVQCRFSYQVNGASYDSTVNVGDAIFASSEERVFLAPKITVVTMHDWIRRHPGGSLQIIHYDRSNPNNISLAGADSELRSTSPYDRLWFGILVSAGGLVMIAIGKVALARSI